MNRPLLVFVVETIKGANTDYQYLRRFISLEFPGLANVIPTKPVYMKGKSKYNDGGTTAAVNRLIRNALTAVHVIFCIDLDNDGPDFSGKKELNKNVFSYCQPNLFKGATTEVIWFNRDVEDVFLGHKVPDGKKVKEAEDFTKHGDVSSLAVQNIEADDSAQEIKRRSNIKTILKKYFI